MYKSLRTSIRLILYFFSLANAFGLIPAFHMVWMPFFLSIGHKHKYILSYFEKKYSDIILKYKDKGWNNEMISKDDLIWVCWFQGEEQMPKTIRFCFESIKKYSGGRKVMLITSQNYVHYMSLPNHVKEKVDKGIISLTHFSDIIRCNLLADYGGIYIDAGLLLTTDLEIPKLQFYSIKHHKTENKDSYVSEYRWVAGFMAGSRGNLLHSFMRDFFNAYHGREDVLIDYFLVDYVIALAYNNFPEVKKMIDAVPYNNEECYYIQNHLFEPLNKEELNRVLGNTSIFRIGYKGIPKAIKENSLYYYLFK